MRKKGNINKTVYESIHEGTHLKLAGSIQCNDLFRKFHSDNPLKKPLRGHS